MYQRRSSNTASAVWLLAIVLAAATIGISNTQDVNGPSGTAPVGGEISGGTTNAGATAPATAPGPGETTGTHPATSTDGGTSGGTITEAEQGTTAEGGTTSDGGATAPAPASGPETGDGGATAPAPASGPETGDGGATAPAPASGPETGDGGATAPAPASGPETGDGGATAPAPASGPETGDGGATAPAPASGPETGDGGATAPAPASGPETGDGGATAPAPASGPETGDGGATAPAPASGPETGDGGATAPATASGPETGDGGATAPAPASGPGETTGTAPGTSTNGGTSGGTTTEAEPGTTAEGDKTGDGGATAPAPASGPETSDGGATAPAPASGPEIGDGGATAPAPAPGPGETTGTDPGTGTNGGTSGGTTNEAEQGTTGEGDKTGDGGATAPAPASGPGESPGTGTDGGTSGGTTNEAEQGTTGEGDKTGDGGATAPAPASGPGESPGTGTDGGTSGGTTNEAEQGTTGEGDKTGDGGATAPAPASGPGESPGTGTNGGTSGGTTNEAEQGTTGEGDKTGDGGAPAPAPGPGETTGTAPGTGTNGGTSDGGDTPTEGERAEDEGEDKRPLEEEDYEYEFPDDVEGDFKPDTSFEDRIVRVDLGAVVETKQEEIALQAASDACDVSTEETEETTSYTDQGLIYVSDYEANPVMVVIGISLSSLATGGSRRLQAASAEENTTAIEVSTYLTAAALDVAGSVSTQLLDDGFTADNVAVTVGNQGNVSMNVRFPVGTPALVAQIVLEKMLDPDAGLETVPVAEKDGTPVSMSDLYGGVEYVTTEAFEIPPDPELVEIYLRVVTQRDLQPWWYRDANGERRGIVKQLIQQMNSSALRPGYLKLQVVSDDKLPNSTAGLVNMLSDGTADIAIGPVMLSADDMTITSLSSPLLTTGHILIIPKPHVAAASIKFKNLITFLAPFTTELWIATVCCVLLSGFILWLLERDADHSDDHDFLPEDGDKENLAKSLWLSMGTYNAALVTHSPLTTLGRLFSISYALLVFVIINSYTANLASYLVTEGAVVYTVDSLEAANGDPDIRICVFQDTAASVMATQQYPNINYVYIDSHGQNNTLAMQEAKQKLYTGECSGFLVEEHIGSFYLNLDISVADDDDTDEDTYSWCDLMQKGTQYILPGSYGVPVNYNLPKPIQEVLEEMVESIRDSDILPQLIQTYLQEGSQCPVESDSTVPQLSLIDLFGIIAIFFAMAFLSTIQLVWTFFIKKRFVSKGTVIPGTITKSASQILDRRPSATGGPSRSASRTRMYGGPSKSLSRSILDRLPSVTGGPSRSASRSRMYEKYEDEDINGLLQKPGEETIIDGMPPRTGGDGHETYGDSEAPYGHQSRATTPGRLSSTDIFPERPFFEEQ